jgi:hypothetical protein
MKRIIYIASTLVVLTTWSCTKNSEGHTGILSENNTEKPSSLPESAAKEYTDRYVAEDGSAALVTFQNAGGKKEISITSNKITIKAPETATAGLYAEHDYEILAIHDSLLITQGNNEILLKKARAQ